MLGNQCQSFSLLPVHHLAQAQTGFSCQILTFHPGWPIKTHEHLDFKKYIYIYETLIWQEFWLASFLPKITREPFLLLQPNTRGQSRCFSHHFSHVVHLYTCGRDSAPEYSWFLKLRGWPRPHLHKLKFSLSLSSFLYFSSSFSLCLSLSILLPFSLSFCLAVSLITRTVSDLSSNCYKTVNKIVFSKFNKNNFESS